MRGSDSCANPVLTDSYFSWGNLCGLGVTGFVPGLFQVLPFVFPLSQVRHSAPSPLCLSSCIWLWWLRGWGRTWILLKTRAACHCLWGTGTESIGDEMVWGDAGTRCWESALPALDAAKGEKISPLRSSASWVLLYLEVYPGDSPTSSETLRSLLLILQVSVMARNWRMLEVTEVFLCF